VAISFVVQSAFVLTNVWLARQVGVETPLVAWFVAWPMSKLIAVLPISLGGIGVREAALVSLLVPYGGAPREAVLASGILWQAVLAVTGLVGLIVTQMLPRLASVSAAVEAPAKQS
jgi:glycosyltransferase 2 family protein